MCSDVWCAREHFVSISPLQCSSCSVHPALCTLHCEWVELSDHFMTTFALQCAVKFDAQESILIQYQWGDSPLYIHCSVLCSLCTFNGLSCLTTLCLSALTLCSVQWSLMPTVHRSLCTLNCLSTLCLSATLGIVHCVCMCVHYAVCTVYFERVELSEHFMSICTVHCASNSVHCSMLYILHFERVELSEHFMSICRGLDVSPTLLRLPPPICVLLSFSTFSSLNIEHRDSLAKRSSPSYLCATLLFYSQHFLHFLYWKNIEKNH